MFAGLHAYAHRKDSLFVPTTSLSVTNIPLSRSLRSLRRPPPLPPVPQTPAAHCVLLAYNEIRTPLEAPLALKLSFEWLLATVLRTRTL